MQGKGLTREQGAMIPASNVQNLMLKEEILEAAEAGKFTIIAAKTIDEGIEFLTGVPAGNGRLTGRLRKGRSITLSTRGWKRWQIQSGSSRSSTIIFRLPCLENEVRYHTFLSHLPVLMYDDWLAQELSSRFSPAFFEGLFNFVIRSCPDSCDGIRKSIAVFTPEFTFKIKQF